MGIAVVTAIDEEIEQVEQKLEGLKSLKANALSLDENESPVVVKRGPKKKTTASAPVVGSKRRGRPPGSKNTTTATVSKVGSRNKKTKGKYDWKQAIYISIDSAGEEGLVLADIARTLKKNKDFHSEVKSDIGKLAKNVSVHLHLMRSAGSIYKGEDKRWFIADGIEMEIPGYNMEEAAAA